MCQQLLGTCLECEVTQGGLPCAADCGFGLGLKLVQTLYSRRFRTTVFDGLDAIYRRVENILLFTHYQAFPAGGTVFIDTQVQHLIPGVRMEIMEYIQNKLTLRGCHLVFFLSCCLKGTKTHLKKLTKRLVGTITVFFSKIMPPCLS